MRISDWSSDVCSSDLAARSWSDLLEDALIEAVGEQGGVRSHRRFERAFPSSYQRHFDAAVAVEDIHHIEEAIASGELSMNLHRPVGLPAEMLHFKIYVLDRPVPLSDILPMLENMGPKVIGEVPYDIDLPDRKRSEEHTSELQSLMRISSAVFCLKKKN